MRCAAVEHGVYAYAAASELSGLLVERMQRLYRWAIHPDWIVFLPGSYPACIWRRAVRARENISSRHHRLLSPVPRGAVAPRAWTTCRWRSGKTAGCGTSGWPPRCSRLAPVDAVQPAQPGGTIFSRDELAWIATFAAQHDLLICSDEIHCDLLLDQGTRHLPSPVLHPRFRAAPSR